MYTDGDPLSFESPPGKQPAVRAGIEPRKHATADIGRSQSFGGLGGGSFLRLHEIVIQKINEEDEDRQASTRRSQPEERLSNGNSKQIEIPDGKRKRGKDSSSSSSEASFSEQEPSASLTSDSPEAAEQRTSPADRPRIPQAAQGGLGKLVIPKREFLSEEAGRMDLDKEAESKGSALMEEDSNSDGHSSDVEFSEGPV